jgi:hypothetical protein
LLNTSKIINTAYDLKAKPQKHVMQNLIPFLIENSIFKNKLNVTFKPKSRFNHTKQNKLPNGVSRLLQSAGFFCFLSKMIVLAALCGQGCLYWSAYGKCQNQCILLVFSALKPQIGPKVNFIWVQFKMSHLFWVPPSRLSAGCINGKFQIPLLT